MPPVHELFAKFAGWPGGRYLFSRLICFKAPYFASIRPLFLELRPGRSVARFAHRRAVQNHIGTVHAIALCNAAELVAGTLMEASLPRHLRWIPKGMNVQYTAKAKGPQTASAECSIEAISIPGDVVLSVQVCDEQGTQTLKAEILMWVSARKD